VSLSCCVFSFDCFFRFCCSWSISASSELSCLRFPPNDSEADSVFFFYFSLVLNFIGLLSNMSCGYSKHSSILFMSFVIQICLKLSNISIATLLYRSLQHLQQLKSKCVHFLEVCFCKIIHRKDLISFFICNENKLGNALFIALFHKYYTIYLVSKADHLLYTSLR
jgi:hypothetical protein